jgi:hypothetical protein
METSPEPKLPPIIDSEKVFLVTVSQKTQMNQNYSELVLEDDASENFRNK